jgi:hypothetical protein
MIQRGKTTHHPVHVTVELEQEKHDKYDAKDFDNIVSKCFQL